MRIVLILSVFCLIVLLGCPLLSAQAQDKSAKGDIAQPFTTIAAQQKTAGAVVDVEYVEFKAKGESKIVVKDKSGKSEEISLDSLGAGAKVFISYRKEKDRKDKEKNVLVSVSVIKSAEEAKKEEEEKKKKEQQQKKKK